MKSNDKLRGIGIIICACYYFDDIVVFEDLDIDNILVDKKP